MPDLLASVSPEQITLLETMAEPYLGNGEWPVWQYVVNKLDGSELDAERLLRSLPRVGSEGFTGLSYGAAWLVQPHITEDSRPGLTVAAAFHLPILVPVMAQPFLNVLRVMTQMRLNAPESPHKVKHVAMTPEDVKRALPGISDVFMNRLPGILDHEPPTTGGGAQTDPGGQWSWELPRKILKYKDVRDLRSYIERVTAQAEFPLSVLSGAFAANQIFTGHAVTHAPIRATVYVDESLIRELEGKSGTTQWKLDKLTGLLRELNSNYADEHPYACHALLRAILDHVPPIFQLPNFDQVANNHSWPTPVDKKYIASLNNFRTQGHDVLHRQIGSKPDLIHLHDVPPPVWLSTLLRRCIDLL